MDINELKGLLDSATPGPWEAHDGWVDEPRTGFTIVECSDPIPDDVNNARLIAAAPTHLANLITALELLDAVRDDDACRFDHNNSCQTHGDFCLKPGEQCYMARIRALLDGEAKG